MFSSMLRFAFSRGFLVGMALWVSAQAQETPIYRTPSPALAEVVDAPQAPMVVSSPDRHTLLLLDRPGSPSIAELAQPELRLAGLRLNPATNGPSSDAVYTGLTLIPTDGGKRQTVAGLPAGARIGDFSWSRDSRHVAFTVVREHGIELWVIEVAVARARRLTDPILNATLGDPMTWLDNETLVIRRTQANRPLVPVAPAVPTGPIVQENRGQRASARTYEGLLASPHDETLFEYYGTAELARVDLQGQLTPLPVQGLITSVIVSPDEQHVFVHALRRPFSYLVPSSRFPATLDVYDRNGRREHHLADLPLWEGEVSATVRPGLRGVTWRADAPATLSWFEALKRGPADRGRKPERDAWYTLAAPFQGAPVEQQRFEFHAGVVTWSDDNLALVTESWRATRLTRTWKVAPGRPGSERTLLFEYKTEDRYADPGRPVTMRNPFGRVVLQRSADGGRLYLAGPGASDQGDRPFLDELDLTTRQSRRLWRSAPPDYEEFVAFLDASLQRALVTRESPTAPINYFVRDLATGTLTPLTDLPNPYPQFNEVRREVLHYRRADGVALSGTLYLPPAWTPEKGPLPTLVWAYPREFLSTDAAEQVKATPERYSRISATGPLPFLLAGYAVLNDASMPIVGKKDQKPNDTYVAQLVANAQAAVDELVRRGVSDPDRIAIGGHSYGAFMTANLLAHSRLFRAGIARSGAYNRTLTPFGFQNEQRTLWQARDVYAAMSPFNFADKVKDPLLLIHGEADDNSGTFPLQSERFYAALKAHGATARFVLLPHEAHGYRARESLLHMLWEMETWLDTYVKSARPRPKEANPPKPDEAPKPNAAPIPSDSATQPAAVTTASAIDPRRAGLGS